MNVGSFVSLIQISKVLFNFFFLSFFFLSLFRLFDSLYLFSSSPMYPLSFLLSTIECIQQFFISIVVYFSSVIPFGSVLMTFLGGLCWVFVAAQTFL